MSTLTVNNFGGRLTRYRNGDVNSGLARYDTSHSYSPFNKPGNLTWQETATRIDPNGTVITDLIVAGKERVESGIAYVYAVGHTGRVYKIQVNDPLTYNSDYDNPVLLTTLTSGSPTFTRGGSMEFFGATERMYIGHDKGVTRLDFDGTNETAISGTWTQNVPRQSSQFLGKCYFANGSNIAEIDSTGTVTSSTKLSPSFPDNTQVRDIDLSSDGRYLHMVVSRLALPDITSAAVDTTLMANSESYIFKWNGTDASYTTFDSIPSFSLTANVMFGNYQYVFGYDLAGCCVFNPQKKILSHILAQAPLPNGCASNGNILGYFLPEFVNGFLRFSQFIYGSLDMEVGDGLWRQLQQTATGAQTDVLKIPWHLLVSNFVLTSVTSGYAGGLVGQGKYYFSTLETSAAPTTAYKLYKCVPVAVGNGTPVLGVYETQTQLFSKKIKIIEVRVYTEPLVTGNGWQIDLIGSDGNVITNSTTTFTVGTNATAGQDRLKYTLQIKPSYALGLRITNTGTTHMTFHKVEIDYEEVND